MNADEDQKRFTDQLPDPAKRKLLHRAGAAVVGTGLAAVPGTAKSGDGVDTAIEILIRAFAQGYDSTRPVEGSKPANPLPRNTDAKSSLAAQQSIYSTEYGEAEVRALSAPQFVSDPAIKAYQKIVDGFNQLPGAKKGDELPNGIRVFAAGKSPKSIPKGIIELQKNTKLTPQEKSQVLGIVVLLLRSGAVIIGSGDDELRAQNGAQGIVRLAKLCPEITHIEYNWYKPKPAGVDKKGLPLEKKPFEALIVKGNLGEFLASDIQYFNPHSINDPRQNNYTLYDEDKALNKTLLALIEKEITAASAAKVQR
jgi:hypothetical protein